MEVLVSFNVISLFTQVPTTRAAQVCRQRLQDDPSLPDRTNLTVEDICSLLGLCLEATYNGTIYQQVHGTAMGSPVLVVVANLVMEDNEQKALSTFLPYPSTFLDDMWAVLPVDLLTTVCILCNRNPLNDRKPQDIYEE